MIEYEQLDHVARHVADLGKSCDFYGRVMGLEELPRPGFNFPGAWFRIGERQELHLIVNGREPVTPACNSNHFALRVKDIDAAARHLQEHGVAFRGPNARPDGARQIFLSDPDGHTIELCWGPLPA
jgi:catechol 2,3-dioxygenase-like lactoylglutathione lyase family enzyme